VGRPDGRHGRRITGACGSAKDGERARTTAFRAVEIALRRETPIFELRAQLAVARVLRALDRGAASGEIEAALERSTAILEKTGARSYEPFIHEERAGLAQVLGDGGRYERELREAYRRFAHMGATGHAERLAGKLTLDG
jgi:hypothetical protein